MTIAGLVDRCGKGAAARYPGAMPLNVGATIAGTGVAYNCEARIPIAS